MLLASAKNYDSGKLWEAKRMATHIHTLVHNGGSAKRRTISLLSQLGMLENIEFLSSSRGLSTMKPDTPLLVVTLTSSDPVYSPFCITGVSPPGLKKVKFLQWWDEPVYRLESGQVLTRRNLIYSMRNQDGGSHIDGELTNESYVDMMAGSTSPVYIANPDRTKRPIPNAHLATVRQIAWEVLQTLNQLHI